LGGDKFNFQKNQILLDIFQIAILESDANLWRENGMIAPLPNTKAEKEWVRLNRAVPFKEEDNVVGFLIIN
jgi:ASC-1-like (ASCH) protein